MRKSIALLALFATFFGLGTVFFQSFHAEANRAPRLTISIFKYGGLLTERHEKYFNSFKEIIVAKVLKLSQELEGRDKKLDYISNLRPDFVRDLASKEHVPFIGDKKNLYDHWSSSNALQVLWGRVRSSDSNFYVRSEIFLGDLKGYLKQDSITLDLAIVDDEFDTTRDSHTLITLYALGMDALARGRPTHEVILFLSEANARLPDLAENMQGIADLKKAIKTALEKL